MATTPRLGIVELSENQSQKATYVNNGFLVIDAAVARVTGDTITGQLKIARSPVATSGNPYDLWIVPAADTGLTAGANPCSLLLDGTGVTRQMSTGAIAAIDTVLVTTPSYSAVGASVVTAAASLHINGQPLAGANVTITNSVALHVAGGAWFGGTNQQGTTKSNVSIMATQSGGQPTMFYVSTPTTLNLTASTEANCVNFAFNRSVQWATGALTTQREFWIRQPTYTFVGASTVTTAATVAIEGAPVAGANATITNNYALWLQDGGLQIGSNAVAATVGISRAAITAGQANPILRVVPPADTGLTNNASFNGDVIFDFGTNHKSIAGGGTVASWDCFQINGGTIDAASAQTLTAAATVHISGNPVAGTNVTITNSCALQVQGRVCFGNNGAQSAFAGFFFQQGRNATQYNQAYFSCINSGNPPASTESSLAVFDPNGTITWSTGNLTTQGEVRILQPTYAALGASVFTNASCLRIAGAPVAGSNMTLTNSYAIHIQGGGFRCTGHLCFDGGSAPTAAAGAQSGGSPPAPVVNSANDTRGNITFGTGTAASAGDMVDVTFNATYSAAATPRVMIVPKNSVTAALNLYISAVSTSGFSVSCGSAPSNSQANTVYSFDFVVVG